MTAQRLPDKWDATHAAGLDEPGLLLYRSNLLGSDHRITNYGGGNTSAKVRDKDPLTGAPTDVLWVKGSGGDLGSMQLSGFATLRMDRLNSLRKIYRGVEFEDEMVALLPHCTFNLNPRAASIDTPLHAYAPFRHVDHMHPDAIIAIAAARDGQALTQEIFGDRIGWLPWKRPGFELGLRLSRFIAENPDAKGVILQSHGLFTWADSSRSCYGLTLEIINRAMAWLDGKTAGAAAFGGPRHAPLSPARRFAVAARLMPAIRGLISRDARKAGHFDDGEAALEFVCSHDMAALAALGTSCPDHFLRTKIRPLVIDFDPLNPDAEATIAGLPAQVEAYREEYAAYWKRCANPDSPAMRDPNAVVCLAPGVGMFTFARDKATARIAAEFYTNAINVMRGASAVSTYQALPEQEAFDIEYWALEEAKLQRMPAAKSLAGRVAFITGGAGGIGRATARELLRHGACVMLADIDAEALTRVGAELAADFSGDVVDMVEMDVTAEHDVQGAFEKTMVRFGGVDIVVSNAGIAASAPVEDTSLAQWDKTMGILSTGYFLVSREAFRCFTRQDIGGAVVFVASKNGLAASPGASAYCTAKAAEIHLARCLALEGAERGIRVNTVNPDAVLRGSKIWTGEWLEARSKAHGADKRGLEEHYRQRSLLKRSVFPHDIARAVCFLASDQSEKSTGNIINVDAGNINAFTR